MESRKPYPVTIFWGEELTSLKKEVMTLLHKDFFNVVNNVNDTKINVVVTTHLQLVNSSRWYALIKEEETREETRILPANVTVYLPTTKVMYAKIVDFLFDVKEQLEIREAYFK